MEKWFTLPDYPKYEINENLEIRHKTVRQIKKPYNDRGYLKYNLELNGEKKKPYAHRLVASVFIVDDRPELPNKQLHHIDGNPLNNHWTNLRWVTQAEHLQISRELGQNFFKISKEQVIEIRNEYSPQSEVELAKKYSVTPATIYRIAIGESRQDVPGGKFHPQKGVTFKVVNTKTGQIYASAEEVSEFTGHSVKNLRRWMSGERINPTPYRYLGREEVLRTRLSIRKQCEPPLSLQKQLEIIRKNKLALDFVDALTA